MTFGYFVLCTLESCTGLALRAATAPWCEYLLMLLPEKEE
jgi:hypothetical protein